MVGRWKASIQSTWLLCRLPKSEAEARMALILEPTNVGAGHPEKPVYTFGVYVEEVFLPLCRRKWKESTRMTTEPRFNFHLLPAFGPILLKSMTRDQLQGFLDEKAKELSRSVVDHLRWDLNAIFKTALSDGIVDINPAAALFTPACKETPGKRFMTPDEIRRALSALELRERLIFRMAVFDGMRPGEILAIQLGNIRDHSVLIGKRVYKGDIDTPKGRKGKRTARTVALSPGTMQDLAVWRETLPKQKANSFLFPTERNTPLSRDNVWNRQMAPKLEKIGMKWATFQVLRRTNAQLARKADIEDKVAADQRGHGLGVSLEVYSQSDLEQKMEAVKRLESEVIQ